MGFRDDGKVYLEVGVNGRADKQQNPNVPYGAEETARDVIECIKHGATAVQFHARRDDGRQAWADDDLCRSILTTVTGEVDAPVYPGYSGSLDHIWALAERPPEGAELLLAPFEPSRHLDGVLWDEDAGRFRDADSGAPLPNPPELDRFAALGLTPSISVFNAAQLRWVWLAARIGMLRQPLNIKLFFSDQLVSYNDPAPEVLDLLISRIPAWIDHEIVVVPHAMNSAEACQDLWELALDRGLGIRVGLGDCVSAFRTPTNAALVDRAMRLITKRDLSAADRDDVRSRFTPNRGDDEAAVRVVVNRNRCMGWGVCYQHIPEIFQPDADGFCDVIKPLVGEGLADKALEGASVCPERAIRVELCEDDA